MSIRKNSNNKIKVGYSSKSIPIRNNGDNYYYVTNFEQTTEKECKEFDKTNRSIYEKYLSIYKKIERQIENCPFQLDKKPKPPDAPTNLERLINWRQNNIEKNVRLQTISVLYLLSKNFNISLDYSQNGVLPCDMIEVARRESENNLELMIQESEKFLELQKKSLIIDNDNRESSTDEENEHQSFGFNQNFIKENNNFIIQEQPKPNLYPNIPVASAPPYFK